MHNNGIVLTVLGALAAAAIGGTATWALSDAPGPNATEATPVAAARTSFPDLEPASGEPTLPDLRTASPPPDVVATLAGPFDDRFRLQHLVLDGHVVSGSLQVTSDVSDLLELQVLAGFYDRDGDLLGTGRYVHHLEADGHSHAGPPSDREHFRIVAPSHVGDRVASATVGVPVLVNE